MKYHKLVRDRIPEIIRKKGKVPKTHTVAYTEYYERLEEKLSEEVREFVDSDNPSELADILEIVYALAEYRGISKDELERIRKEKAEQRGSFDKKIILD